jgi:hypothetical protein
MTYRDRVADPRLSSRRQKLLAEISAARFRCKHFSHGAKSMRASFPSDDSLGGEISDGDPRLSHCRRKMVRIAS